MSDKSAIQRIKGASKHRSWPIDESAGTRCSNGQTHSADRATVRRRVQAKAPRPQINDCPRRAVLCHLPCQEQAVQCAAIARPSVRAESRSPSSVAILNHIRESEGIPLMSTAPSTFPAWSPQRCSSLAPPIAPMPQTWKNPGSPQARRRS